MEPTLDNAKYILENVFMFKEFKQNQEEVISLVLDKKNTLAIMPTGGGKSLCFQIPSLLFENLTIVISPLIALMKDQYDGLVQKGLGDRVAFINSSQDKKEREHILYSIEHKKISLLYLAPETLKMQYVLEILQKVPIELCVIDEAHCISTWGSNFRPDYLRILEIITTLHFTDTKEEIPILALTATATKKVITDISRVLKKKFHIVQGSHFKENLHIECLEVNSLVSKQEILKQLLFKTTFPTIIFVPYQRTAEKVSELINSLGFNSHYFHSGMDSTLKKEVQDDFISNKYECIVATIAFGMGIDKSDIRTIIHLTIPQSIENYVQEIGRAGRDGKRSKCICCISEQDIWEKIRLVSLSKPSLEDITSLISFLSRNKGYHFFSIRKLSTELRIDEIALNLVLKELESREVLKIYANVKSEFKCEKLYDVKEFESVKYNYIEQAPLHLKKEIEALLSHSFFISKQKKWLPIEEILASSSLSYFKLVSSLTFLIEKRLISGIDVSRSHLFLTRFEIEDLNSEEVYAYFENHFKYNYNQIIQLSQLLRSKECIQKKILSYFDEELKECGHCHNCLIKHNNKSDIITSNLSFQKSSSLVPFEELTEFSKLLIFNEAQENQDEKLIILKSVVCEIVISKKDLSLMLTGTLKKIHATWKHKVKYLGVLKEHSIEQITQHIDLLIAEQMLEVDINDFLRITQKGFNFLKVRL